MPMRTRKTTRAARELLGEYRRKRDFSRTEEPAGGNAATAVGALAFVVQKHAASQLHYDLRLEADGVMKSWAVPKGPSLDPSLKRLAMQVEDHPIEYNTFEGTIPKGEYGGGTVMLWDRGWYSPDELKPGEDPGTAVRRGLRAGKLSFTLHGDRLHGSFALVRTHAGPRAKWLLIKHRDEHAAKHVDITAEVLTSVTTGRTMQEIAGESSRVWHSNRGDMPAGEAQRTVSEASSDLTPMKPKPVRSLPDSDAWTFEPWRGGERVLAFATSDATRLVDSRGRNFTRGTDGVVAELSTLAARSGRAFVVEAELVQENRETTLYISDLLVDGARSLIDQPWRERRGALEALLRRRRLAQLHRQEVSDDGAALIKRAQQHGWAGVYARHLDAAYRPGRRSDQFLRIPTH